MVGILVNWMQNVKRIIPLKALFYIPLSKMISFTGRIFRIWVGHTAIGYSIEKGKSNFTPTENL